MANKEAKTEKENKNKKSFFKGFKAELKKVSWPTPKQLVNNTIAVITIVLITAAIVFILDLAFESLNKHGIDKIKEVITASNTTSEEEASTDGENNGEGTENKEDYEVQENNEQQEKTPEDSEANNNENNAENNEQ